MAVEIIPAIMPVSFNDLKEKLGAVSGLVSTVQIDVMDGVFVPPKSWPYTKGGPQEFAQVASEKESLPYWKTLNFEADLMVGAPESAVFDWIHAGAKRIIVHIESTDDFGGIIELLKKKFKSGEELDVSVAELGIALNTTTPNERIHQFIDSVDFVQCMGIARIGYQGEPFDRRVLPKISALRGMRPEIIISVDGGVDLETAPKLIEVGVNRLAVGSAIFESENIKETIQKFKGLPS